MNEVVTIEELFQRALLDLGKEATAESLVHKLDTLGAFEYDRRVTRAIDLIKLRIVRDLARQGGWVDENDEPIEVVNVHRINPETGKKVHWYLDLGLCTFDDQKQLVQDRLNKAEYFRGEARRFYEDGCRKFGRKFQRLFQFN